MEKCDTRQRNKSQAVKIISSVLKIAVPLAVSAGLVIWLLHKIDFKDITRIIKDGCDLRYIFMMMGIMVLSHVIRGIRWGIQLRAAGIPRIPVIVESISIFGAYALNLVVPYLGEGWRCVFISRREKTPLSVVVGTDLGDRISDAIVVAALLVVTLFVAHPVMERFIVHYHLSRDIDHFFTDPVLWFSLGILAAGVWVTFHFFGACQKVKAIEGGLMKIWDGFKVLFHMKGITLYLVLTIGIWTCYFMETYCCFFAFPFTRALIHEPGMCMGLIPGLVVFVFGSLSIAIPSNGGLGPWNIAVMFALSLYGVSDACGAAYSMTVWCFETLTLIILGIFTAGYIAFSRKHKKTPS